MSEPVEPPPPPTRALVAGLGAAVFALLVFLPGLDAMGLWSEQELPVLDRTRAALGEPLRDLVRHPWLPDQLRTWSYGLLESELGLRLPHALAAAVLVGLTAAVTRRRGGSWSVVVIATGFALSFPGLLVGGRTVLGNPIGEALAAVFVVSAWWSATSGGSTRLVGAIVAATSLVGSVASTGIVLGGAVPLGALALSTSAGTSRRVAFAAAGLAAIAALVGLRLAMNQGEGYIPLLGAAPDPNLVEHPRYRPFTASVEDLGFFVFPWAPLLVIGALASRSNRWPTLWLAAGLIATCLWTRVYGETAVGLTVPAALVCAGGLSRLLDQEAPAAARRLLLLVMLGGLLIMAKDGERTPSRLASPLHGFAGEHRFPGDAVEGPETARRLTKVALYGMLAAYALAAIGDPRRRRPAIVERIPPRLLAAAPSAVMTAVLLHQSLAYGRGMVARTSAQLSARPPLERWRALADAGTLPPELGTLRIRDPGLTRYGPPDAQRVSLRNRSELRKWLNVEEPRVALLRDSDFPSAYQMARSEGWPLHVIDWDHHQLKLVANHLPDGLEDLDPLSGVVFDEPPPIAHETYVKFEDYVEVVGWEIEGDPARGETVKVVVLFHVLRRMPASTQLFARFKRGRLNRFYPYPFVLTEGKYPPNYWRPGDYILHKHEAKIPTLELIPGDYDFFIGLRRTETKNFQISEPIERKGNAFGVEIRGDKAREFVTLGQVALH